jgi:hypothetical protein
MLKLDQDTFITNYVTTFLATHAAEYHAQKVKRPPLGQYTPPISEAILYARTAWYELIRHFDAQHWRDIR